MKSLQDIAADFGITFDYDHHIVSLPDWNRVLEYPEFKRLSERETTSRYHQEHNQFIHTKMVCSQMQRILFTNKAIYDMGDQLELMLAALFHDVGKCDCENTPEGKLLSADHALKSEHICRRLLWDLDVTTRENICELVRWHDLHCQTKMSDKKLVRKMNSFSDWLFDHIDMLFALFRADDCGSIKDVLLEGSANEMFYRIKQLQYNYNFHCRPQKPNNPFTVYVMCGLPGSGKSTYAKQMFPDLPVVSRDLIREELGMTKPGVKYCGNSDEEDIVSKTSDELVDNLCKNHQSFVYDNMNTREKYRRSLLNKISRYRPTVKYIYLEVKDLEVLKTRRPEIAEKVDFETFVDKMDFPRPDEYDTLTVMEDHSVGGDVVNNYTGMLHMNAEKNDLY